MLKFSLEPERYCPETSTTLLQSGRVPLPNLMICADSMHSKKKIAQKYPKMNSHIIEQLYGVHVSGDQETLWEIRKELPILFKMLRRRIDKQFAELNAIDLTQFYADTPPVMDFENRNSLKNLFQFLSF